jgi:hypothetical protein
MPSSSTKPAYLSLREYLVSRPDIGAFKGLLDLAFEPANPFDPKATRSPKRSFVLFSLIFVLFLACFAYFNLRP